MPSFRKMINIHIFCLFLLKTPDLMKVTKSLQVPGNFPLNHRIHHGKKVLRFTLLSERMYEGSLTIEAAVCLPLFLMLAAALMEPMRWLDRQRQIQTVTEEFCGELSQYYFAADLLQKGTELPETPGDEDPDLRAAYDWLGKVGDAASGAVLYGKIKAVFPEANGIWVRKAEVPDSDGNVCLDVEYGEKIPFFPAINSGISMHAAALRRVWIGTEGKLESTADSNQGGTGDEEMVYVGSGMGKYHLYRDCHYISNEYRTIDAEAADSTKNSAGRYYKPCVRCCKNTAAGVVYVTQGGEHYHADMSCSAMISYVRKVPLEEVEYLGCCSVCRERGETGK